LVEQAVAVVASLAELEVLAVVTVRLTQAPLRLLEALTLAEAAAVVIIEMFNPVLQAALA
jgi:hypothetical protein